MDGGLAGRLLDGTLIGGDRLGNPAHVLEDVAHGVVRFGQIGGQRNGASAGIHRVVEQTFSLEGEGHCGVGFGTVWIQTDSGCAGGDSLVDAAFYF